MGDCKPGIPQLLFTSYEVEQLPEQVLLCVRVSTSARLSSRSAFTLSMFCPALSIEVPGVCSIVALQAAVPFFPKSVAPCGDQLLFDAILLLDSLVPPTGGHGPF